MCTYSSPSKRSDSHSNQAIGRASKAATINSYKNGLLIHSDIVFKLTISTFINTLGQRTGVRVVSSASVPIQQEDDSQCDEAQSLSQVHLRCQRTILAYIQ